MQESSTTLNRSLGFWSALALVVGTVIGSGIFFKQSSVLDSAGSTGGALLVWFLGGVITLTAGLTIAEVGAQMPHTGGLYVYMEEIYGNFWGFLSGWMQIAVYGPAIIASIAAYLGILLVGFFHLDAVWQAPLAIFVIILIGLLNMVENRWGAAFQIVTTLGKLLPIIAIVIFGLFYGDQDAFGQTLQTVHHSTGNFGVAVLATLFAYDGWILVANLGGEIKNPPKAPTASHYSGYLSGAHRLYSGELRDSALCSRRKNSHARATNHGLLCPIRLRDHRRTPLKHRDHRLNGGVSEREDHDVPAYRLRHGRPATAPVL